MGLGLSLPEIPKDVSYHGWVTVAPDHAERVDSVPFKKWKRRYGVVTLNAKLTLYSGSALMEVRGTLDLDRFGPRAGLGWQGRAAWRPPGGYTGVGGRAAPALPPTYFGGPFYFILPG
jgi:hypothetical protein